MEEGDWDPSQEAKPVPIPQSQFAAMSLDGRGYPPKQSEKTNAATFDAQEWFNGGHSGGPPSSFSKAQDTFGRSVPSELEDDKAYVVKHRKEMEALILRLSSQPFSHPSLAGTMTIRGQKTMWIDPDPIYATCNMDNRNPSAETLAIFQHKTEIIHALRQHQVLIVEGFTGSGKTTQIPQYILDEFAAAGKLGNIVVTQPRRIAAQAVADRVCKERQWVLGDLVGYQVGLNRRTSEKTRLTYMTTGVLLQTLISKKSLTDYTHIIVDEVHERDLDTDLLILVIKKLMLQTTDRTTKIILMSATLNADKFADYFPKWGNTSCTKIVRIPQTTFHKVNEYYLDTLQGPLGSEFALKHGELMNHVSDEPKLQSCTYDFTVKMLEALDEYEEAHCNSPDDERGGVLAFLPGLMEIDTMYKRCIDHMQKKMDVNTGDTLKWTLLPLHSSITTEEQQKVFHPCKPGYRKIILATNIAESSITVTDISFVIDFCLTKSISCDPQTNYSCLRMEWASQDQCVQRRGRVGRVSEGHLFRMITKKAYHSLGRETVPDMEKACLENVILSVKTLDLGSPTAVMALAIDPPGQSGIKLAISNLKEAGALTIDVKGVYQAYDGDLTMMGSLMSKLPFDIRYSRLIALGQVFGVLEEAVIIASGLSVKSAFSFPFTQRLLAYLSKLMWSGETFSDSFAIINLYRTWMKKSSSGGMRNYAQMRSWKQSYYVQTNVLREMNLCINDIIRRLRNVHIQVDTNRLISGEMSAEQGLMLKIVLAGAFYPNFFVRFRPVIADYARQITRELNSCDPLVTLVYTGFPNEQPGELYASHIAQKYESVNSAPYIKVNGSKALVQFDHRGDKVGPLSINLFRGVKMRQLRMHVQFGGVRSDIARTLCNAEINDALDRIVVPCPKSCPLPGINENYFLCSVTRVTSPDNFWVVYHQELAKFNELTAIITDCVSRCNVMRGVDVVPGLLCIVKFDGQYYRARVEYITTDKRSMMLFLIDVGAVAWKAPSECFYFNDELIESQVTVYPALAMNCRINEVKPLARYSGAWSKEACDMMAKLLSNNNNVAVMDVHSVAESVIACDIYGRSTISEGKDAGLRGILLNHGLAVELDEPKPNRENHCLRKNFAVVNFNQFQIDHHNKSQRIETTPPILLRPPVSENCTQDYLLKGPFSPLEMTFRAMSASTHTKGVTVEGCSVNSVALDQDPASPTSRVLVAAGVGISQRSGSVILRETTLLPPIPGLAPMLTMMFCPMMQLRAEGKCSRYTGCLSGLGKDHAMNRSVYPDHDMEVVFDTLFDAEDIHIINAIRVTMNLVLNGEDAARSTIDEMRRSIREDVRRLLERSRPSVEEIYPRDDFVWKDDPKKTMPKVELLSGGTRKMGFSYRQNDVFPVHSLEVLPSKEEDENDDEDNDEHSYELRTAPDYILH